MTFVSVLNFFTRVNLECRRFNGYLCVRAEKNSELSKTSKMKLLEKTDYLKTLTIFAITFILDVALKYTSEEYLF